MFMKQATTDRLLGMLVTLATGAAILYLQVSDDCLSRVGAHHAKRCVYRGFKACMSSHASLPYPPFPRSIASRSLSIDARQAAKGSGQKPRRYVQQQQNLHMPAAP